MDALVGTHLIKLTQETGGRHVIDLQSIQLNMFINAFVCILFSATPHAWKFLFLESPIWN